MAGRDQQATESSTGSGKAGRGLVWTAIAWAGGALSLLVGVVFGGSASVQALPEEITLAGDIQAVDYLPENIAPGGDCGGGRIALTINTRAMELRAVEVRDFRTVGVVNARVVMFDPGQVRIGKDGSFSVSEPLAGLEAVSATLGGTVDLQASPAAARGSLRIFLTSGASLCETTYSATFSAEGLPPVPTPTQIAVIQEPPGALIFTGVVSGADARASTGLPLGPCGGGNVRIVTDADANNVLGVAVTGFASLGGVADTTRAFAPGEVPIAHGVADGFSFHSGGDISEFIDGRFDFTAAQPFVAGYLGTRGVVVCEAAFSAVLTAGEPPARQTPELRLPSAGAGGSDAPRTAQLLGLVAVAAIAFAAIAAGLRLRRR